MKKNELHIEHRGDELIIRSPRNGRLVLQIGVDRGDGLEWNYIDLPKKLADEVREFLCKQRVEC